MKFIGDFAEDATVRIFFTTNDAAGAAVAPSSAFEAADIDIYKDGSATQKTSVNGLTMTSPFDSMTGLHLIEIDTSNDTGDAGFWATGSDYTVVLTPDETVDGQTVVAVLAQFSIENRFNEVDAVKVGGTAQTGGDLAALIAALNDLSAAEVNAEVVDVIRTDTITELAQAQPSATPTLAQALMLLYMALRNKRDTDASSDKIHNDAGTVICKSAVSDDGTTFSRAKLAAGP